MAKNLVIVESPAKAKTIEGYLGKDFIVKSSFGHVRDLDKKGVSIDIEHGYEPKYVVSPDKKKVVDELKKLVKDAETVWLATDEDREGEAISWHLYETLKLEKKDTKRITFNEITKPAILKAIEQPRKINQELVNAQQARRVLDRLVGFELSPVLWRKVRPSLSAGRVQSVAVRMIVEREREIDAFNLSPFYRVYAHFLSDKGALKTEVSKQIENEEEAVQILQSAQSATFRVVENTRKPIVKKPVAPFTTSTLQQEASLKLGFSVLRTMAVAQQLYEAGYITYMRTDSVNLSDTAIQAANREICSAYGNEFAQVRKYTTKTSGAQEAHEAIRPTDFASHRIKGDSDQEKLYELIWKRAISSQMSDAQLERTTIQVEGTGVRELFTAKGEVVKFEGFLKVYMESDADAIDDEEDEQHVLPDLKVNDSLTLDEMTAVQRFTRPPSRYVEASLVKKMESLGIGRPSTYAPTITTIQKRGYVEKSKLEGQKRNYKKWVLKAGTITEETLSEMSGKDTNKLVPTDIGLIVTDFLIEHFGSILDYHFTAKVEQEFDEIAQGLVEWTKMIDNFYKPFHVHVENTLEHSERATGERELGIDPVSNRRVIARYGRFGPIVQIGDEREDGEKPRFASLRPNQSITTITLEDALELFKLPRVLGEKDGQEIKVNVGRFGPYVQLGKTFVSVPKDKDIFEVTLEEAIQLLDEKVSADANKLIKSFDANKDVQLLNGKYGAYLKIGKNNYRLPKSVEPEKLSLEECLEIAAKQGKKPARTKK